MAALKRQVLLCTAVVLCLLITAGGTMKGRRQSKKNKYCDPNKHWYYHKQWGRCKKCDRCPKGFGLEDKDVLMDPLHGALDCKRCRPCIHGTSFNNRESFKECKTCRNCSTIGKVELQTCTVEQNTQCVLPPNPEKRVAKETMTRSESVKPRQYGNDDIKDATVNEIKSYFWISVVIVLLPVMILVVAFRRKIANYVRHRRSDQTEAHEMNATVSSFEEDSVPVNHVTPLCNDSQVNRTANFVFNESRENHLERVTQLNDRPQSCTLNEATNLIDAFCTSLDAIGEAPVTNQQKLCIAMELAKYNKVCALGAALDIDQSTVELIEDENEECDQVLLKLLVKWEHLKGRNANKKVLSKALITIGCPDLIDILRH